MNFARDASKCYSAKFYGVFFDGITLIHLP